jgi:hypothetical protein
MDTEPTRERRWYQFSLRTLLIFALIGSLAVAWWPMQWDYDVYGEAGRIRLVSCEPTVSIVFLGLPDEHDSAEHGSLIISGLGWQSGSGRSSTGFTQEESYFWGVAEIKICDRLLRITNRGRTLTYRDQAIYIPGDRPLELIIDALGRLSRPSEPTRSSFRGPPECLEHVGHHRGRQSGYWQPPNLPRVVLESQIPAGIRTETI